MAPEAAATAPLDRTLSFRLRLVNKFTDKSSANAYAQEFGLPVGLVAKIWAACWTAWSIMRGSNTHRGGSLRP